MPGRGRRPPRGGHAARQLRRRSRPMASGTASRATSRRRRRRCGSTCPTPRATSSRSPPAAGAHQPGGGRRPRARPRRWRSASSAPRWCASRTELDRFEAALADGSMLDPNAAQAAAAVPDGEVLGTAVLLTNGTGYLMVDDLPALDGDRTYQLWGHTDGGAHLARPARIGARRHRAVPGRRRRRRPRHHRGGGRAASCSPRTPRSSPATSPDAAPHASAGARVGAGPTGEPVGGPRQ